MVASSSSVGSPLAPAHTATSADTDPGNSIAKSTARPPPIEQPISAA